MKIKSIEDLKKLFDILDDGDTVIVSNKDYFELEPALIGGNLSYPVYRNIPKIPTNAMSYGGKTIFISVQEKDIVVDIKFKGESYTFSKNKYETLKLQ